MQVTPLFPSFLAEENTLDIIDNNSIRNFCDSVGQTGVDPFCDELNLLSSWVEEQAHCIAKMQGLSNVKPIIDECWINYTETHSCHPSHSHMPHAHPKHWISFVYYVNVKEMSGGIVFMSPHQNVELTLPRDCIVEENIHNSPRWNVTPYNGLAVAFPSWLTHFVEPNHSGEPRISIAYNVSLVRQ